VKLTLSHLDRYNKMIDQAGIDSKKTAPILLPEYRGEKAISRALDIF
jgi:hypothetical protein